MKFWDLRFVKFQLTIISLISFCNYLLFFLSLKYRLDIKDIWQIQNKLNILFIIQVKRVVLNDSFLINTNKLTCQL